MTELCDGSGNVPVCAEYDVVVVGGGPAGVGAALAAARHGMKTLIVEQFNCLGGVATAGGHAHISRYEEEGTQRRIVGGIANEIADRLVAEGHGTRNPHAVDFEIEWLKFLLERMAYEAGVEILYYTFFCDAIVEDGAIRGVVVQNKSGRSAILAKRVIDCTGDGDVGASAGCPWEQGRPSDSKCQPVTLMFTIGGVDFERVCEFREQYRRDNPDDPRPWKLERVWAEAQKNGDMEPFQSCIMGWWHTAVRPDWVGINFTHIIHVDATNADDLTRATIEGRRQAYHTIDVYRKCVPGMENCYMVSTPNTVGLRESRRIMGRYVLTVDDIKSQREFDDAICYASFFVDIHCIDGPGMDPTEWHPPRGFKYHIPFRILVPQKVDNLLVAGRCVSATHLALGSIRVMVPCICTGEAAGYASAISIASDIPVRAVDVAEVQAKILEHGGILTEDDIRRNNP